MSRRTRGIKSLLDLKSREDFAKDRNLLYDLKDGRHDRESYEHETTVEITVEREGFQLRTRDTILF